MACVRGIVVTTILFCAAQSGALAQRAADTPLEKDATALLDRVRDTYQKLSAYHFTRVLVVEESQADGKPAKVAELTLDTATDRADFVPDGRPFPALNIDRIRMGTRTARLGEMLLVCDGAACWSYTSQNHEYMTGNRFRDVSTSVGGSALTMVHLFPFLLLQEGAVQDAKVARMEEIEVGGDRRMCYVVEGAQYTPPGDPAKPPPSGSPGVGVLLTMLTLQGLAEEAGQRWYSPWPSEETATGAGEPAGVTLWIDRETLVLVRSRLYTQLYKRSIGNGGQTPEKVTVTVTDRFTSAALGTPPADVFRFTPRAGATEVPNAASRRNKKP